MEATSRDRRVIAGMSRPRHRDRPARRLHELAAEDERVGDVGDRRDGGARAGDEDGSEVEEAAPYALLDFQGLDLVEVDLDRVAFHEPGLRDDAAGGGWGVRGGGAGARA